MNFKNFKEFITIIIIYFINSSYCIGDSTDFQLELVELNSLNILNNSDFVEEKIVGFLGLPESEKKTPAVILLHGCAGLGKDAYGFSWKSLKAHAQFLISNGFATLIVDSHGSRNLSYRKAMDVSCTKLVGFYERTGDVYGGIRFLHTVASIEKKAIFVLGQSQGGMVALNALDSTIANSELKLAGGIAYYPYCNFPRQPKSFSAPVLILIGSKDDITPASRCKSLIQKFRRSNNEKNVPKLIIYDGVHHSFDYLSLNGTYNTPIGTVASDKSTTAKSREVYLQFLKHLFPYNP